jgi:hypothetical protein
MHITKNELKLWCGKTCYKERLKLMKIKGLWLGGNFLNFEKTLVMTTSNPNFQSYFFKMREN